MSRQKLPSDLKEPIFKCMEVTKYSAEGAHYFAGQLTTMLADAKMTEELSEVQEAVNTYAQLKEVELAPAPESWDGQTRQVSVEQSMKIHEAAGVVSNLSNTQLGKAQNVTFGFAVSDNSEIMRAYQADGQFLQGDSLASGDKLFNGFLAEKGMVIHGSVFYEAVAKGEPTVRVDPQKARDTINDPDTGYAPYMKAKGINLTCEEQHAAPAAQKDMQSQQAMKDIAAVRESLEAEASVEAEAPSADAQSTMRAGG